MPPVSTRTVDQTDDFFGTAVADPYRWLENTDDPEVAAWLVEQAATTRAYLDALPGRAAIGTALRGVVGLPTSGLPEHRGSTWFRTRNDGVQQQDVLVVSAEPFGAERVLIDPNPLTDDSSTSLASAVPNRDGTLVAYSYTEAGSDWNTWRVREVDSGTDRSDVVRWSKFTEPTWLPDGTGFLYGAFDAPDGDAFVSANTAQRLQLHRLGTDQAADKLIFDLPDEPDISFWPHATEDGRWLIILGTKGTEQHCRVWIGDQADPSAGIRPLIAEADASWWPLGSTGDTLLMTTDRDAPLSRVVTLDALTGEVGELVGERADALEGGVVAGGRLALHWLHDATSLLTVHELSGTQVGEVALPELGSVTALSARADEPLLHIAFTSFTTPSTVLGYDMSSAELATAFTPSGAPDSAVVTEQIWVTSKDGTRVPVFLLHRPDVTPATGPHPAWLYGYGGFRISMTPTFEPTRFTFAEAGGVSVIACLRGGGEFGATWHDGGRLADKQNVFDDAIAVAEHLVKAGWTTPAQLAASGRSNGGLLAGALLTQRPELFACVVPEVGVLDMLRFPLWTIGWAWISDYGDPRADAEQFRTLFAYSPLHRLRENAGYPPVLVLTSDHDDRVVPAHSIKFAAQLQAVSAGDATALLRVAPAGGHGHGRSHDALIAERGDVLAFLSTHTGLSWG
ncbi:MAG: prolyl oligopeptidase family serine peptidase [Jatrophihabitans sp.]